MRKFLILILTQIILFRFILSVPTKLAIPALGDIHVACHHQTQAEFIDNIREIMQFGQDVDDLDVIQRVVPEMPYAATSLLAKIDSIPRNGINRKLRSTVSDLDLKMKKDAILDHDGLDEEMKENILNDISKFFGKGSW